MANNADNNLTKSDIVNALHKKLTEDKGIKATKDLCNRIVTTLFDGESGLIADWLSAKAESNAIIKVKKIDSSGRSQLMKGGRAHRVTIPGFGTFGVTHRKARQGRHPKTGATLKIPATYAVTFRPGKTLKDSITG
jgi:nucleoid DNA-binding protein